MSRSDDFFDSVDMHRVTPENMSLTANSIASGDMHAFAAQNHKKLAERAVNQGNQQSYDSHTAKSGRASINASKAYGYKTNVGSRSASFKYDLSNVQDYLN